MVFMSVKLLIKTIKYNSVDHFLLYVICQYISQTVLVNMSF